MKYGFATQRREGGTHPEGFGKRAPKTKIDHRNPASHRNAAPFLVLRDARRCCGDAHVCAQLTDWERTKSVAATTNPNH